MCSKNRNNNHNANQFFSTITVSKNDLDPLAQMFARMVMQIKKDCLQEKKDAVEKFKNILETDATNHKKKRGVA